MDFDEEDESYLYLPNALISREIPFLVSDEGKEYFDEWKDSLKKCSEEYKRDPFSNRLNYKFFR